LLKVIKKHDRNAFFMLMDVRAERGGYMRAAAKKK